MKKVVLFIIGIIITMSSLDVSAKDDFYSLNKHQEETFNYIIDSYNNKNENDGLLGAGIYSKKEVIKENEEYLDTQIMLVKYNKKGKVIWEYNYGKTIEDTLYSLTYSYNEQNQVDGYLLLVEETKEKEEIKETSPIFLKIDLKGTEVKEQPTNLPTNTTITKIIPTYNSSNTIDGYIIVGSKKEEKEIGFIAKYDKDLNQVWIKDYNDENYNKIEVTDIIPIKEDNITKSYVAIAYLENQTEKKHIMFKYDIEGNIQETVKEDFEEKDTPKLLEIDNSYIVYGYTNEVKYKNDFSTSYYIIKYNSNNEEEWETISNTPTSNKKPLQMQVVRNNNEVKEYLIMSTNSTDSSYEITRIGKDGIIKNKVKKIVNEYYDIKSFLFEDEVLYFIGQVNCPEDDNCDYDMKSLFLISTEEKVIEVKEQDNNIILTITGVIISIIILIYLIKTIKNKKENK